MNTDNENDLIDLSLLIQYANNDKDILNELIEAFYDETNAAINELRTCKDLESSERWTEAAHKIKGSAGYVGAEKLRKLSAEAQDNPPPSIEERHISFSNIENAYMEVENALKGRVE